MQPNLGGEPAQRTQKMKPNKSCWHAETLPLTSDRGSQKPRALNMGFLGTWRLTLPTPAAVASRERSNRCTSFGNMDKIMPLELSSARETYRPHRFTIGALDLRCHDIYLENGQNSLRRSGIIEYERALHETIDQSCLFFGPYVPLLSGICVFTFNGYLDGTLCLNFVHSAGNRTLKSITIDSFDNPFCVVIPESISDLEIQGLKTPDLNAIRLEAISVDHVEVPQVRG